jgi:hypothetical protein
MLIEELLDERDDAADERAERLDTLNEQVQGAVRVGDALREPFEDRGELRADRRSETLLHEAQLLIEPFKRALELFDIVDLCVGDLEASLAPTRRTFRMPAAPSLSPSAARPPTLPYSRAT